VFLKRIYIYLESPESISISLEGILVKTLAQMITMFGICAKYLKDGVRRRDVIFGRASSSYHR